MAWTTPRDWTAGEVVTASVLNTHVRDNLQYLKDVLDGSASQVVKLTSALYVGDTSNAFSTLGLTLNQGTADNEILSLKSSDVAHGMTSLTETDTYASFGKISATSGGVYGRGFSTTEPEAFLWEANGGADNTTKSTAAKAFHVFRTWKKNGASSASPGANANLLTIAAGSTVRFIFDADGDSHQDVGTAWTNYDTHDDVALLNLLSAHVTRPDDPLRAQFGEWLRQNRSELERARLVSFDDQTGHHFVNMSRLQMLSVGAIRQLGDRMAELTRRLIDAERTLALLEMPRG